MANAQIQVNVLLVDSDPENVKNFRAHIRTAFPNIKIVGAFTDSSKDIIAFVRECGPQLIIADIRFFGGVRFMRFKDIHDEFNDVRFIMYGTFNDTDYMKRAREFGVIDFMYRPVKPADFNRCLEQAISHFKKIEDLREQKKILTQNYQERIFQYEEIFLRSLLEGHIKRENEIKGGFDYFNIPFDSGYTVALVRIDHYRQVALTLSEMDKHILIFSMLRITQEALRDYKAQAFARGFNEIAVIVGGGIDADAKVGLFDSIKHSIHEQTQMRVSVGIGRTYEGPCDIAVSFREADAAFRYRYRVGFYSVIPIEFVEPDNSITYRYPADRELKLVHSAVVGDYEYCKNVISELFGALNACRPLPDGLVAKVIMTVVFNISRYINEQNLPIAREVLRFFPSSEILGLNTPEEGEAFLDGALRRFCEFIGNHAEQEASRLHQAAREYVRGSYHENFSVSKIAVSLGTTPENLNKVFLEREQMTLFDFVMWVRVYEAQQLLETTDLDEEVVAVKVGFDDVKYFRSVFKKYHGDEPREFRLKPR